MLLWWIATFDLRDGPIGAGDTAEEARANLIVQIAHAEPRDLRGALGELATPGDILGAVKQIRTMIRELEWDVELSRVSCNMPNWLRHQKTISHWRQVINKLGYIAGQL